MSKWCTMLVCTWLSSQGSAAAKPFDQKAARNALEIELYKRAGIDLASFPATPEKVAARQLSAPLAPGFKALYVDEEASGFTFILRTIVVSEGRGQGDKDDAHSVSFSSLANMPGTKFLITTPYLPSGGAPDLNEKWNAFTASFVDNVLGGFAEKLSLDIGKRHVMFLRKVMVYGDALHEIRVAALDNGSLVAAIGPKGSFDATAFRAFFQHLDTHLPASKALHGLAWLKAPESLPKDRQIMPGTVTFTGPSVNSPSETDHKRLGACKVAPVDTATEVHVVVSWGRKRIVGVQDGLETLQDVVVGNTAKPVVLVLAGKRLLWRVRRARDAKLQGVYLLGEGGGVIGVAKELLRAQIREDQDGWSSTGDVTKLADRVHWRGGATNPNLLRADGIIAQCFGAKSRTFHVMPNGEAFVIGDLKTMPELTSTNAKLEAALASYEALPSGSKGVANLLRSGKLRPATDKDVEGWFKGAAAAHPRKATNLATLKDNILVQKMFFVVQSSDMPENLYGADSCGFIVGKGVKIPRVPEGHSTYLFYDGYRCVGTGCRAAGLTD